MIWGRPRRWIVTILSFDQWLATIEKPLSPMVARPKTIAKPSSPMVARLKNHRGQWLIDQKPLKNHWYQWFLPNHSFNGNGDPENHWCFTMVAITVQKLLPWEIKQTNHHINKIYQICFFPYTQFNFTSLFRIFGILDFFCHTAGKFYYRFKRLFKTAQYSWVDINFR